MVLKKFNFFLFFLSCFISTTVLSEIDTTESGDAQSHTDTSPIDDFWLLEDYQPYYKPYTNSLWLPYTNSLWLYGGIDEDSGGYYGLATQLAITSSLYFDLSATQQNYEFETEDITWGFGGRLSEQFSWAIARAFWGQKDALEKIDTRFSMMYFQENFSGRLSVETGKVELFFRQPNILNLNSLNTDHNALELSLEYSWTQIYSELRFKQHDYQSQRPELARRPIIILSLADSVALQQARNLAEREASILLGLQLQTTRYELLLSQIDSAFSSDSFTYASLSLQKAISSQWQLGANVEIPLNEGLITAGVSLGYMW